MDELSKLDLDGDAMKQLKELISLQGKEQLVSQASQTDTLDLSKTISESPSD